MKKPGRTWKKLYTLRGSVFDFKLILSISLFLISTLSCHTRNVLKNHFTFFFFGKVSGRQRWYINWVTKSDVKVYNTFEIILYCGGSLVTSERLGTENDYLIFLVSFKIRLWSRSFLFCTSNGDSSSLCM